MLTRSKISEISGFKRISISYVEKDYLNDVCLSEVSKVGKVLVFKGGTALYKFYGLNRFSEDLDFTVNKRKFDYETLSKRLVRTFRLLQIEIASTQLEQHQRGVTLVLLIRGPLYNGSKESLSRVPLDFSSRERPREFGTKEYSSIFSEIPPISVNVMGAGEIAAEKIRAIMTRNKPRDLYDLWFLLKKGVRIDTVLVMRKLKLYGSTFSVKEFVSALNDKKGLWDMDLRGKVIGSLPKFEKVAAETEEMIRNTQR